MHIPVLSQYIRADVINRVVHIIAGYSSNIFFGIISAVCLTRLLDVGEYGRYSYILQLVTFFAFLSLPGMGTAVMQSAAQGFDKVLVSGTQSRLRYSMLGTAVIVGVALWRWQGIDPAMRLALLGGALVFPFYVCLNTYAYYLNGKRAYARSALFSFIQTGGICAATVGTAFWTRSFIGTVTAALASKIILDWVLYRATVRLHVPAGSADDPDAFRIGWHLSMVSVISCFGNNFDKVIIGTWISYEVLALYTVADMISGQIKVLNLVMDSYIAPVIVNETSEVARTRLLHRSLAFFGIALAATIAGYWVVSMLIGLFFTHAYTQSLPYVAGLLAVNLLSAPGAVISTHLRAQKRMMEPYMIKIMESAGFLIALAICVPLWGVWGIIIALGVGNTFYSVTGISLVFRPRMADHFAASWLGRFIQDSVPRRRSRKENT